ncbi:MAG: 3'-5' exonuclease [Myxococcota bacterium]|jgi:DNA helicase-2/ATP-dependent DNA helicase PcrA|nr:3'-5' exonuclease [Myxococcota bacterium]
MTPPKPLDPSSGSTPAAIQEETTLLRDVRTLLLENPEPPGASDDQVLQELIRLRDEFAEAKAEDRGSILDQIRQSEALLGQLRRGRQHSDVDPDNPYFGHLRISEEGRIRDVCLGKATRLSHGLRIVDWRHAPISRLFYRYREGEEYVEEIGGRDREGAVLARRTVHVSQGELLRIDTSNGSYVRNDGDWLTIDPQATRLAGGEGLSLRAGAQGQTRLGGGRLRVDKHLPDIAGLIDPEQFEVIVRPASGAVVLRGTAGSGKTTVALHRIAYLHYCDPQRFHPRRILVMVWGRALRDYVAHVLPALGIPGVQVTTWSYWARKTVAWHFQSLPRTQADDTPEPVSRVKLHPGVALLLERHIASTPGPGTWRKAISDWAYILTDRRALTEAMGGDIGPQALERAIEWNIAQQDAVMAWVDGDTKADARLDPEDDALLLRAWQLRVGPLQRKGRRSNYSHLVLDEVQDFSPIEVRVLLGTCDSGQSITMAGDTRQHISEHSGFASWSDFLQQIGVEATALETLEVSYRSTHPITRFALKVLGDQTQAPPRTTRDGPPVELYRFGDHGACVAFLAQELHRLVTAEPLANVAVLTPNAEMARMYHEGLAQSDVPGLRLVTRQRFEFAPGIDVVEVEDIKGLEFDYVVVVEVSDHYWPDTPRHRRLLHVAATRAMHQLWVTSVRPPSPLLPAVGDKPVDPSS